MKQRLLIGSVILVLASILMLVYSIYKLDNLSQIENKISKLPKIQGDTLIVSDSNKTFPKITTVIIFFNSGCEHCQYQANAIQQELSDFAETNLLFISEEPEEKIIAFSKEHKLDNKEGVWWLKMQPEDVYKTFGNTGVPHIWIYDEDGKLVKEFRGETKVEAILEWL